MDRIAKIQKLCGSRAAIVTTPVGRRYLTDFPSSAGTLVITERSAHFIIDFRYFEAARGKITDAEVLLQDKLFEQIDAILKRDGCTSATFEREMSIADFDSYSRKLTASADSEPWLSDALADMRRIKTPAEIARVKKAQAITDAAFTHILNFIQSGMTEIEIALELESFMRRNGSEGVAFDTICVAGRKSSLPHGVPDDHPVNNGDFLTMDFGARYEGYCSDMTRTVALGSVTDEQKAVYDIVFKAQAAAVAAAKSGITGKQLDAVARDIIYGAGYEGCFGHGLGHSLGIEVHENPRASIAEDTVLLENMLMTIEPGIYIADRFGVRIEDTVVITENGVDNLATSDKRLIIL